MKDRIEVWCLAAGAVEDATARSLRRTLLGLAPCSALVLDEWPPSKRLELHSNVLSGFDDYLIRSGPGARGFLSIEATKLAFLNFEYVHSTRRIW